MKLISIFILTLLLTVKCFAQDSSFVYVHFLYVSTPKSTYATTEKKWWGGLLGGHVGVGDSNKNILHFMYTDKLHYIAQHKNKTGKFFIDDYNKFYTVFKGTSYCATIDSIKKVIIAIPVSTAQLLKLDSLQKAYTITQPYDYAFLGMRCASAAYNVLDVIDVVPHKSYWQTIAYNFYPAMLRKKILKSAKKHNWKIKLENGGVKRKWEA